MRSHARHFNRTITRCVTVGSLPIGLLALLSLPFAVQAQDKSSANTDADTNQSETATATAGAAQAPQKLGKRVLIPLILGIALLVGLGAMAVAKAFRRKPGGSRGDTANNSPLAPTTAQPSTLDNIVRNKAVANALLEELKQLAQKEINTKTLTFINFEFNAICVDIAKNDPFVSNVVNKYYGTIQTLMYERSNGQRRSHPKEFSNLLNALIDELSSYIATAREEEPISSETPETPAPSSVVTVVGVDSLAPDFTGSMQNQFSIYTAVSPIGANGAAKSEESLPSDDLVYMLEEQKSRLLHAREEQQRQVYEANDRLANLQSKIREIEREITRLSTEKQGTPITGNGQETPADPNPVRPEVSSMQDLFHIDL